MKRILDVLVLFLVLPMMIALSTCDENPADQSGNGTQDLRLKIVSGNNQTERTGARLPDPLVVMVTDLLGNPARGVLVGFHSSDSASVVSPAQAVSGSDGTASCIFTLGTKPGTQRVTAAISSDSAVFNETAVEPQCEEEQTDRLCDWRAGRLIIATTSSSLLVGAGTVVIEFDPDGPQTKKLCETQDTLTGMAFSPRGELFLASRQRIYKMNPSTYELEQFCQLEGYRNAAIAGNPGGIVAGITISGPFNLLCPPTCSTELTSSTFSYIKWENVAVHPSTRDLYFLTGQIPTSFELWRMPWDGRAQSADAQIETAIAGGSDAHARGMCFDAGGNLYMVFDGNDNFRRIVMVDSTGVVHNPFFDFHAHAGGNNIEAGRWGDITCLGDRLFVIDTRNNRLVAISRSGEWLEEFASEVFSLAGQENEHYSIVSTPSWNCD